MQQQQQGKGGGGGEDGGEAEAEAGACVWGVGAGRGSPACLPCRHQCQQRNSLPPAGPCRGRPRLLVGPARRCTAQHHAVGRCGASCLQAGRKATCTMPSAWRPLLPHPACTPPPTHAHTHPHPFWTSTAQPRAHTTPIARTQCAALDPPPPAPTLEWSLMRTPRIMTQLLSRTPLPITQPAEMLTSGLPCRA